MTLVPLLTAKMPIPLHATAALLALLLGAVQFARPKRDVIHRWLGRSWIALMVFVSVSSFWISGFRIWGPFSPIHLLSVMTLAMLVMALRAIMRGDVRQHRNWMIGIYTGALVITGAFTLLPGRTMHLVLFGG